MAPDDDRMSPDDGDTERGLAPAERAARQRSVLRVALVTLALVAVLALIAVGIVRIVQS
jgi:hypothetical protein